MGDIKPIQTIYNGFKFRSRLEARWAVFFDSLGIDYEYEPEGYILENGVSYLPDFLIHTQGTGRTPKEFYVEVKGSPNPKDTEKIKLFSKRHPIIVVGNIYNAKTSVNEEEGTNEILNIFFDICQAEEESGCNLNSFEYIDGDPMPCVIGVHKNGNIGLFDSIGIFTNNPMDVLKTVDAIVNAKQARFEHQETPCPFTIGTIVNFTNFKSFEALDSKLVPKKFVESKTGVIIDITTNKDGNKMAKFLLNRWEIRKFPVWALERFKDEVKIVGHYRIDEMTKSIWRDK